MQKASKKAIWFFCISLAVVILSGIFIWGFQTSWGDVKINRLQLVGENGSKISTLIYIPENATNETPAPAVVIYHGRSNQAHSNDTWCMELARRGYVVLSPDLSGGGESDVTNRDVQAITVTQYAKSLPIVDGENINIAGYSLGCFTDAAVYGAMSEDINSVLFVFGPFMVDKALSQADPANTMTCDVGIIKAVADQYDYNFIGGPEECITTMTSLFGFDAPIVSGEVREFNGHNFQYQQISGALHQTGNISSQTITAILNFEEMASPAPVQRATSDQAWVGQQLFSAVAAIAMMFLLAASIGLLLELPAFQSITNTRASRKEQKGVKAWVLDILFALVIPAIIFIPVSAMGMAWFAGNPIITSDNLNGIMFWLLAIAVIGVVRTLIKRNSRKKNGETIMLSDYCLAAEGETHLAKGIIWKSLIIGVGIVCFLGLLMTAFEAYLGIDFQIWNLSTYLKPSGTRIIRAIPYMLIIFTVMFLGNINQRVLPSTGNEKRDMWIAVTVNTVLTASALFVLLVIQYGGSLIIGTGKPVFDQITIPGVSGGTSVGALDFAFGYCYMMGGSTGVVTYIYRKYGNILVGVIPASIFCGLFTLLSFTLVR